MIDFLILFLFLLLRHRLFDFRLGFDAFFLFWLGGFLFGGQFCQFLEAVDSSGGVSHSLFAGIKRMAGRANFHFHLGHGGAGDDGIAASANDLGVFVVFRVDILFHDI